ncbi:sarcosine oxidase/N-methyl-L-tryptophan oxidase [Paraburkholderia phenazinium]|uniref:Sarcosine oxidase/N-methyl-L-tryptophan oxidase n=2 Tax=Paraburkholderia phenazinium TaxID=60549 RepID=A0A1G8MDX0_9BURK|nr:N-methyl-L-tryptophan oxidase [Paraburkholderia phenazinium]SDI66148.1 sarcosine oxidase/N-methyl-L-tryptophan oxidase [Paraburkholderia phenazinium]
MHDLRFSARSFDTLIVGAGSMGMAAGYYLSKAGNKVLLLDAGDPPHDSGSHHGSTRLIRHAYGEGAAYVPLALRAQQLWLELEQEADASVFERTGIVNIGPPGSPFMREVQRSASQYGLSVEFPDASEARRRWPAWQLSGEQIVSFEPDAGVLYCEQAVTSYRHLASTLGATLRTNTLVTGIELHGQNGVSVITDKGERFTGRDLIVCAGKWSSALLQSVGARIPVARVRKTFAWFDVTPKLFEPDVFPGFAIASELGQYYGFPNLDGSGLKVGRHDGGQPVAADAPLTPFGDESTDVAELESFLRRYLPAAGKLRMGKTCEYDVTPDEHFIIDRLPACSHVHVATGFSGHGFKFASAIGEALAERITQGASRLDLSLFSLGRFDGSR